MSVVKCSFHFVMFKLVNEDHSRLLRLYGNVIQKWFKIVVANVDEVTDIETR